MFQTLSSIGRTNSSSGLGSKLINTYFPLAERYQNKALRYQNTYRMKSLEGVSSGYDDIYETIDNQTYLPTIDNQTSPNSFSLQRQSAVEQTVLAESLYKTGNAVLADSPYNNEKPLTSVPKTSTVKFPAEAKTSSGQSRPSTKPPIARKPMFHNSFRTRQVSEELNKIFLQRSETRDSDNEYLGHSEQDSPNGFEDSFIDETFTESDVKSYEVLCPFDADDYCKNHNLQISKILVLNSNFESNHKLY